MSKRPFLPYGRQTIEDDDLAAVALALQSDMLTTGPLVEEFEARFAAATGARHAVACNSGTAALHLAVMAEGIGPGDVVVVPSITFLATPNAVRMTGADVIFADVDPDNGLMTPDTLAVALRQAGHNRAKAAIPVHLNGQICDMKSLREVAAPYRMTLIEDACHALGVASVGEGTHSRAACFSTHPVKAIATGEGGCITTSDQDMAARMRLLRNHGMTRTPEAFRNVSLSQDDGVANPWYYEMTELGWNYRLPDILCALGISQLGKLPRFWQRRNEVAALYDRLLEPLSPVVRPVKRSSIDHGWHLYAVLIDFAALGVSRARFMTALKESGIGTQVHYIPVHRQPYYRDLCGESGLHGADAYYARCLSLPLYPSMADDDVRHVVDCVSRLISDRTSE